MWIDYFLKGKYLPDIAPLRERMLKFHILNEIDALTIVTERIFRLRNVQATARGITLVMCYAEDHVMQQLERDKLVDLIGKEHVFAFTKYVTVAFEKIL